MKFAKSIEIGEFAALVAAKLEEKEISTVLTGGAVVSIYTKNQYMSYDADFITAADTEKINKAMSELGFVRKGKDFSHPDTKFFVEFPTGPLAIGSKPIKASGELIIKGNKLKLLSPTESVMDRLAGYFFWNDMQNLDQAIAIAEAHPINFTKVKKWAEEEGMTEKYQLYISKLKKKT